jgi:ATP-dependent helicase HrpB
VPIDEVLPQLKAALERHTNVMLMAEPGAGKTTRVPLALRPAPWLGERKIVMLEPRRIVARAAARYMASLESEEVGESVGYSVRFESRVSAQTRIEIVTEGVLTRRLQGDPTLSGIGLLIFDEFHERSLDGDLALALALDIQEAFRPDLRILVMSATLESQALTKLLKDAPIIRSRGRLHPVATYHLGRATRRSVATDVAHTARLALERHEGSILAFLPGEAEIRRAEEALRQAPLKGTVDVVPLHGSLGAAEQDRAIAPAAEGQRKIVLATTIAETSLTIEGISVVIDGGFKRVPRFDPGSGMTRLETVRVSAAAAEQRRGRAGRLGPGHCYRLWPEPEMLALAAHDTPEILQADLAGLMLDLALWGASDPMRMGFLDQPPRGAVAQARELLVLLRATDREGQITEHGKKMARLPLHPRLAHMVIAGQEHGEGWLAADIAALLQERDILQGRGDANLHRRLDLLHRGDTRLKRVKHASEQIRRLARTGGKQARGDAGRLLALAYGDRIAQARDKRGSFRMANGGGAVIEEGDPLSGESFLAVGTTDGAAGNARIFLAAPLALETIEETFGDRIELVQSVHWDRRLQGVSAKVQRRLGALVLEERPIPDADPERVAQALLEGVGELGLSALTWSEKARSLQQRVAMMRRIDAQGGWPDLSDEALLRSAGSWLKPHLRGKTRRQHLATIDVEAALAQLIRPDLMRRLKELLPERITVPSGSSIAVDYASETFPILRVKLQEMFGAKSLPPLAQGKLPLRIELLSPAGRPLAVTQDLESFWTNGYREVRAQMRGRYPKHHWPEDPLSAPPSRRRPPRGSAQ